MSLLGQKQNHFLDFGENTRLKKKFRSGEFYMFY